MNYRKIKILNFVGDPTRIRQIFLNLLSNAVKFTQEGEIKIVVNTNDVNQNKVKIITSIFDSGIGIPADKIKELFKPFSQVTGIEGSSLGGTGLGLVICKEFTNLMEGDINRLKVLPEKAVDLILVLLYKSKN